MPFDPTRAFHNALPDADPNKENFIQLSIHHRYPKEPPAKDAGFIWWDTSDPSNEKLRAYTGSGWVDLFEHMESTPEPALGGAISWQGFVKDKDLTDPPGSPSTGDRYIVAAVATGDWVGEEDNIAEWDGSAWVFTVPEGGWAVWVEDEAEIYVFNGASWGQESFGPHAATHQDGGSDEISVAALSGLLADAQTPLAHASSHVGTGADLLAAHANVLYVGKQGNDSNDGKHPDRPFLTFGVAITTASGETPSASNRFVIVCQDAGIYDESVTMAQYVSIYAPSAAIISSVILAEDTLLVVDRVEVTGGTTNALLKTGTGVSYVKVRKVSSDGSGGSAHCIYSLQGTLYLEADLLTTLLSGDGIKAQGTGATVIYLNVNKIKVGNGSGFSSESNNVKYRGRVNEIEITGSGKGFKNFSGDVHVTIGRIFDSGSGTGIECSIGVSTVLVGEIDCNTSYSVASGSPLYLFAGKITGTPSLSASAFIRVTVARRDNLTATTDPTVNDDVDRGYTVGSRWKNTVTAEWWVCDDSTANAAVWHIVRIDVPNTVQTTTVAQATLATIAIPDDSAVRVEAEITAFRTNGVDQATYKRAALVHRRSAGIAVLQGVVDIGTDIESDAAWDVDIDIDGGNNARIRVTGADGKTVNWVSHHSVKEVS